MTKTVLCTCNGMQISVGSRRAWSHYTETLSQIKTVNTSADYAIKKLMNTFFNFNIFL